MSATFDAIVIGSGFGGAITACRLAERGMQVLVLERGRRWAPGEYPRKAGDPWLFSEGQPARQNGWLDLRFFKNMTVAQAVWPPEITSGELRPWYDKVHEMMRLQTVPDGQLTQRFKLVREAAERLGHRDRFSKTPLAVSFSPDWNYQLSDPSYRVRRPREEHAGPQLHPLGRAVRRGGASTSRRAAGPGPPRAACTAYRTPHGEKRSSRATH